MSPELSWRHAKLSSHIFPEEGEVVETYFGGYLLDGEVGGGEAVLDVVDGDAVDDLGGSLAALALADGGEILGCDAEGVGILLHLSLFGALVAEHLGETLEQRLGGGEIVGGILELQMGRQIVEQLEEKRLQQVLYDQCMVLQVGLCQLPLDDGEIEEEVFCHLLFEVDDGIAADGLSDVPAVASHEEDGLEIGGRHRHAATLEVGADHDVVHEYIRVTYQQVVLADMYFLALNFAVGPARCAEY